MNEAKVWERRGVLGAGRNRALIALAVCVGLLHGMAFAQGGAAKPTAGSGDDDEGKAAAVSMEATPEQRSQEAWSLLTDALADTKHPQTRIQALGALGMMRNPRTEKMIKDAMADPDLDVRTAAALAAGQTKDRNLTTDLRSRRSRLQQR